MNANIGWLFYKDYYNGLTDHLWHKVGVKLDDSSHDKKMLKTHFERKNNEIFVQNVTTEYWNEFDGANLIIPLTTTYPGLVLGTGYSHETGTDGEFKLGFYFDWTTGQPVIPGSSVKGVLRSAYNTPEFIKKVLKTKKATLTLTHELVKSWELDIFGAKNGDENGRKGKDIFFDAVIKHAPEPFMADDFITPHINRKNIKMSPFSNPTPLQFLKILPGVTFNFRFKLNESTDLTVIEKKDILAILFENILIAYGVGAKTNVGYGNLVKP